MSEDAAPPAREADPVDDDTITASILELLGQRADSSSICPSDVARAVGGEDWRSLMGDVRRVARRLVGEGHVRVTQGAKAVDPIDAHGPIRIRSVRRD